MDHLCEVVQKTSFPWLLSNVIDNLTNKPLADGQESCIVEWSGYKVSGVTTYSLNFNELFRIVKLKFGTMTCIFCIYQEHHDVCVCLDFGTCIAIYSR